METVLAPSPTEALATLQRGLAQMAEADLGAMNAPDLAALQEAQEIARRQLAAEQNRTLDLVDRSGFHRRDGHFSAKNMVRHQGQLSNSEAVRRQQVMGAMRDLGLISEAFAEGSIGVAQVETLARVWANPRVRGALAMLDRQRKFLKLARKLSHRDFQKKVAEWERLIDEDGPTPQAEREHQNRNVALVQDAFSTAWDLRGHLGSMDGAEANEIFGFFVQAEYLADWEKAKAIHGDKTSITDLDRTPAQQRADAFMQMIRVAAAAQGSPVPKGFMHNIVWSSETFTEMVGRFCGAEPKPFNPDTYKCETIDGVPLDPTEAFANAVLNQIRRAVVNAKGVITDLGEARFFTGGARAAVNLSSDHCIWPGCQVATSQCQADHLEEHGCGGRTCPSNGAPLCGGHNRWKQKGYTIQRDPDGTWHIYRPDGTEIAVHSVH